MPLLMPRFGRPGLIGTAARTAVIAGTASATAGAVRRHQYTRAEQSFEQQQLAEAEQQRRVEDAARDAARQAGPPPEPADDGGLVEQQQRSGSVHQAPGRRGQDAQTSGRGRSLPTATTEMHVRDGHRHAGRPDRAPGPRSPHGPAISVTPASPAAAPPDEGVI